MLVRFIREGRFGPPKVWKTGSILDTYPTPLLHLCFDSGGWEVAKRPYRVFLPAEFLLRLKDPAPYETPITVVDLSFRPETPLLTTYVPSEDSETFDKAVLIINALRALGPALPFKTGVIDPVTELSNSIYRHQSAVNKAALADPRKWAGNIGMKVMQVIQYVQALPWNSVCVFHTEVSKEELTGKVTEQPMVYSNLRNSLGGMFSQFFYQTIMGKEVRLRCKMFENVSGIGPRWPTLPPGVETAGPCFKDIYGGEKDLCL